MKDTKTLRDEFAISMPFEALPTINNENAMVDIAKHYDIDLDLNDDMSIIAFSIKYHTIIRYQYADAMIATSIE